MLSSNPDGHHQFIQDRIRHLVDAFSTRAQAVRDRLDGPDTPSSLRWAICHRTVKLVTMTSTHSSTAELNETKNPIDTHPRLSVSFSDRYVDNDDDDDEPNVKITTVGCLGRCFRHIEIIDPNGRTYVTWMCVVTLTLLYNAWVCCKCSTKCCQKPKNVEKVYKVVQKSTIYSRVVKCSKYYLSSKYVAETLQNV